MPVGNVLGRAYIEVHADTAPFAKELGVEVAKIADAAEKSGKTRNAGSKVAESFVAGIRRRITAVRSSIFGDIVRLFTGGGSGRQATFAKIGKNLGQGLLSGIQSVLKAPGALLGAIGSSIGNVGRQGPFSILLGLGIVALIPAIIALVQQFAALVNVIYLIPAAVSTALGAIIPLIFAFHGFSDAISAILSGDPDKISEALKGLTPAARGVAVEFQKLLPFFQKLRDVAQESFFKQISGDLTAFFKALGPTFTEGFKGVATSAGKIADSFLKLFSSPSGQKFFESMFRLGETFFNTIGPGLVGLTNGLMNLSTATEGPLGDLFQAIGNGLIKFGNFLTDLGKSGEAKQLIADFRIALDKLIELGKGSWDLIKAILGSADAKGAATEFLNNLNSVIDNLTAFFKSDSAKDGMQTLIRLAELLLDAFAGILELVISIAGWLHGVIDLVSWLYNHSLAKVGFPAITTSGSAPGDGSGPNMGTGVRVSGLAQGGLVTQEGLHTLAEGNRPEVVIPLSDPGRARQLASASGLMNLLGGGDTNVSVYIDGDIVQARIEKTVSKGLQALGRGMKFGPRPATVGG